MKPIYLDYQATTPVAPEVLEAMLPYFSEDFGNASSNNHAYGWSAAKAVEKARAQVANLIGAEPREIYFTSGATESNNLAIFGIAEAYKEKGKHIVVSAIEHKSVLDCASELKNRGFDITVLPVNSQEEVTVTDLERSLRTDTVLVSIQWANNEIGTIQPIKQIGQLTRARNIFFHTDAVQAACTLPIDIKDCNIDLLSLSAHKIYGPKGVGALFVKSQPRIKFKPLIQGGGQEKGIRPGTLNVPGIVGLGKAAEICQQRRAQDSENFRTLKMQMQNGLVAAKVNGSLQGLTQNLSITFSKIQDVNDFLKSIPAMAVSTGAACTTAQINPSHVLKAIGLSDEEALKTIRFGIGRNTTAADISAALAQISRALQ